MSILTLTGTSVPPLLCSVADTRVHTLFIPSAFSFASLHTGFTPSTLSSLISHSSSVFFNHHPAYFGLIFINVFYFWKINDEPSGNSFFNPCKFLLVLNTVISEISDLCVYPYWNIWAQKSSFIYQYCNCFWILTIILNRIIIIQY